MILLDRKSRRPLFEQIFRALKKDIIEGWLKKNEALKPIRILAEELQVSNNTINMAYRQLLAEGFIRSVRGSGYYVEDIEAVFGHLVKAKKENPASVNSEKEKGLLYDFKYESVEGGAFPWVKWRQYMQNAILEESYVKLIEYECNKGNEYLRASICQYINKSRGVNCTPDQIIICAGTQYAMDILTNVLPDKKYQVGVEEPGYNAMRQIFLNKGYQIKPIAITNNGIDLEELEQSQCNLLYLTPSHQFPTGVTTSLSARKKILEWAKKREGYVIENDYDNEFLYGQRSLPSIQALSGGENVIYLSTLSKVLSPALRCAYLVLPPRLMRVYEDKYKYYYSALPTCHQKALAQFIFDGQLEKHVRKVSSQNRKKYEIISGIIEELLPNTVRIVEPSAGTHLLIELAGCINQNDMISRMKGQGIGIYGTKRYWFNKKHAPEKFFLLGYNSMEEEELETAVRAFAAALEKVVTPKEL